MNNVQQCLTNGRFLDSSLTVSMAEREREMAEGAGGTEGRMMGERGRKREEERAL